MFQGISYIIDVYRNSVSVEKSFINYALYVSFFPQLVAGPIVRYKDMNSQIKVRSNNLDNIVLGIKRFVLGLSKK